MTTTQLAHLPGAASRGDGWLTPRTLAAAPGIFGGAGRRRRASPDDPGSVPDRKGLDPMTTATLEQLDGGNWAQRGDPSHPDDRTVLALGRLTLDELTPANIRFLLERHVALSTLIPMAAALVRVAPDYDAGTGPGDLQAALASVAPGFGRPAA